MREGVISVESAVQILLSSEDLPAATKAAIKDLLRESDRLKEAAAKSSGAATALRAECERLQVELLQTRLKAMACSPAALASLRAECDRLRAQLVKERENGLYKTTEDFDAAEKTRRLVDSIADFGRADLAELVSWLFASSLLNFRVIGQRLDEGSMLWRAVKKTGGPILEVGRGAGGSTILILGASGSRPVVSIDRGPSQHVAISDHVFARPDVSKRLKLYWQTSREPIVEDEFGMIFIDADHSYEGVCHDIATFWNSLKSFDGKPPLAAFHDAADNPISWVPHVKQACQELLAEPGVARVVESWGSMLVVEKIGELDQDRWYGKEESGFWDKFASADYPVFRPTVGRGQLHPDRPKAKQIGTVNLLGDENVEHESWRKCGVTVEPAILTAGGDNPTRLIRELPEAGEHGIEKTLAVNATRFKLTVFLRPYRLNHVRLAVLADDRSRLGHADFELTNASRIVTTVAADGFEISDAAFLYRNGYFSCEIVVSLPRIMPTVTVAVQALDPTTQADVYLGNSGHGFFINLSSVRTIA